VAVHSFTQLSGEDNDKFDQVVANIKNKERNGAHVLCDAAQLFSNVCSRNPRVLERCHEMLDMAIALQPTESRYYIELGRVCILQGQYHSASRMFKDASRRDPQSVAALEGMILCQLYDGMVEDAEAQSELLLVMQGSDHSVDFPSPEFLYIQGILAFRKQRDMALNLEKLLDCRKKYLSRFELLKAENRVLLQSRQLYDFVIQSPDFLLQV
jgi:tetratricopeptide repeat protein 21B